MSEDVKEENFNLREIERPSVEQWQSDLKRLLRRTTIRGKSGETESVREIIDTVREHEKKMGVNELIDSLVTSEVNIQPRMDEFTERLAPKIIEKFPEVEGIVLLGSSIHGGARIREIVGTDEEPDFDWGILTSKSVSHEDRTRMHEESKPLIHDMGVEMGFSSDFHSCPVINPEVTHAVNLSGLEDARKTVGSLARGDPHYSSYYTILYLTPSYPPELNQNNRKYLLSALSELSASDNSKWLKVKKRLMREWNGVHTLKFKHFGEMGVGRELRSKVVDKSALVIDTAMSELLESTGRQNVDMVERAR